MTPEWSRAFGEALRSRLVIEDRHRLAEESVRAQTGDRLAEWARVLFVSAAVDLAERDDESRILLEPLLSLQ